MVILFVRVEEAGEVNLGKQWKLHIPNREGLMSGFNLTLQLILSEQLSRQICQTRLLQK
jgi:hypothetical protein